MTAQYALSAWNEDALYLLRGTDDRIEFMVISPCDHSLIGEWVLFVDYEHVIGFKVAKHRQAIGGLLMSVDAVNIIPERLAESWIRRAKELRTQYDLSLVNP